MKKIFIIAIASLSLMACRNADKNSQEQNVIVNENDSTGNATSAADPENAAKISFDNEVYDFGKVNEGEMVKYAFKFKNTGKTPLIISEASATCGCTVPEIPKEPILPGAESSISVEFDTNAKYGLQDKIITIMSNAVPNVVEVHLIGNIIKKK